MSLYSWKQLARWSIEYSCLSEEQQKQGLSYLEEAWRDFCMDVVNKYEAIMDGNIVNPTEAQAMYRRGESRNPNVSRV